MVNSELTQESTEASHALCVLSLLQQDSAGPTAVVWTLIKDTFEGLFIVLQPAQAGKEKREIYVGYKPK